MLDCAKDLNSSLSSLNSDFVVIIASVIFPNPLRIAVIPKDNPILIAVCKALIATLVAIAFTLVVSKEDANDFIPTIALFVTPEVVLIETLALSKAILNLVVLKLPSTIALLKFFSGLFVNVKNAVDINPIAVGKEPNVSLNPFKTFNTEVPPSTTPFTKSLLTKLYQNSCAVVLRVCILPSIEFK